MGFRFTIRASNRSSPLQSEIIVDDDYGSSDRLRMIFLFRTDSEAEIFFQLQRALADALFAPLDSEVIANKGRQKIDMGEPRGCSFVFNNPIHNYIGLNILQRRFLFSKDKELIDDKDPLKSYYIFEKIKLNAWKKALDYAMTHRVYLEKGIQSFKDRTQQDEQFRSYYEGLVSELAITTSHIEAYSDKKKVLVGFLQDYIQYQKKLTSHGTILMLKNLVDSELFTLDELQEALECPLNDESSTDKTQLNLGQHFFSLDPYLFIKFPKLIQLGGTPDRFITISPVIYPPTLWDKLVAWLIRTIGENSYLAPWLRSLTSLKQRASTGDINAQLKLAIQEKVKGNIGEASKLFLQVALSINNSELAAYGCYELANLCLEEGELSANPWNILQAAEWVKRGAMHDNGNNLGVIFDRLGRASKLKYYGDKFIITCSKQSPIIALKVLENPEQYFTESEMKSCSTFYPLLEYTPWTPETSVYAIDLLAKRIEACPATPLCSYLSGSQLHNHFYKYPQACLRALTYPSLMALINNPANPEDIGSLLKDSAEIIRLQIIEQEQSEIPTKELISYIQYAETTDLSSYNSRCSGLRELENKNIDIIDAIAKRAETNTAYANLLQRILGRKTPFNACIYDDKSRYEKLEIVKNTRLLAQGHNDKKSLFFQLPKEILLEIAAHTSDGDKNNAYKIALNNFNKPK